MRIFAIVLPVCALAIALLVARPAFSFLPDYTAPGPQTDHWDFTAFPVTWQINPTTGGSVTGSTSVTQVIQASFATWQAAPNAALQVSQGPNTTSTSPGFNQNATNNINLVCFVCNGDFSKDVTTLAVTMTTTSGGPGGPDGHGGTQRVTGQLLDADILFNPSVSFTTVGATSSTVQDLQTIATHEIGHFFGLDHSGVVRAVMFPFAPDILHTLSSDDVAGISSLYPGSVTVPTGTISGTVNFSTGGGVFGAHVYADSVTGAAAYGGNIRKTPIGTLTRPDGTYSITGLPQDSYTITAEPLDDPVSNTDVSDYPQAFGKTSVQTNFTTRQH
jgi:hypothetical protein